MAKILTILILFSVLFGDEFPPLDENTWVVFDIDGPIECEVVPIIHKMQQSAGAVFGLTALQPPLNATVLRHLALLGIDFTFTAPARLNQEAKAAARWERGVLFIHDFNQKAEIFSKWLEMAQFRPSKLVIIDTGNLSSSNDMEEQISGIEIPCQIFHITKQLIKP